MSLRDKYGRFSSKRKRKCGKHVISTDFADEIKDQTSELHKENSQTWKNGRRLVEFDVLLTNLRLCKSCRHGPVPLIENNICGELQKGLSGYLYVRCSDCGYVNRVAYGKTHRVKRKGMPCFDVNTKLGTGKQINYANIFSFGTL
jgi:RNase P subunit RPR2